MKLLSFGRRRLSGRCFAFTAERVVDMTEGQESVIASSGKTQSTKSQIVQRCKGAMPLLFF